MNVIIIGNGITGLSAARILRKRMPQTNIVIVSEESDYPYARTALMYVFMGHLTLQATECYSRDFYSKDRLELVRDRAVRANPSMKKIQFARTPELKYDALLIATGSRPMRFGWPGQDLPGVQGLYSIQDLESLGEKTRSGITKAVIVGGGLIGIELAEMLHSRGIPVIFIVREDRYAPHILPPEESELVHREIRRHGLDLRLSTELKAIKEINGRAGGVVLGSGEEIACDFVGLTAGVTPNIDLANESDIKCKRGVLVTDQFETNHRGVYAAGDCAQFLDDSNKPGRVEQLWYTGRAQGELAGEIIADHLQGTNAAVTYKPGIWFNSAKFFTIEQQVYGAVNSHTKSVSMIDEKNNRAIRISYSESKQVLGFHLLGIRYRQTVCEEWIRAGQSLSYVIEHLSEANFDPEFSRRYESELKAICAEAGV